MEHNLEQLHKSGIKIELRRKKEKTLITLSEGELREKSDKILNMFKKECVDLRTWFYIIVRIFLIKEIFLINSKNTFFKISYNFSPYLPLVILLLYP
jgi:hypothetical protein